MTGVQTCALPISTGDYATKSFSTGLLQGYNTMDGLASLAFGIILIEQIRRLGVKSPGGVSMTTVKAGILSVVLMAVIYGLLTYAGAQSVNVMALDGRRRKRVQQNSRSLLRYIRFRSFGNHDNVCLP